MRLHLLLLLFISGLSQNVGYAGTLVGDWYQEEIEDTPNTERRAFSQPTSQSTEANQVTLGIKSPGLMDPVDFYAVISGKPTDASCQYAVSDIMIDAETFSVGSNTYSSDIPRIMTRTDDEQERLWRGFKKGQNLSLRIDQLCSSGNVQNSEVLTFNFSLNGSSAAYRFVARLEAIGNRNQESRKFAVSGDATRPGDAGTTSEDESIYTILFLLVVALFIVVLVPKRSHSHTEPDVLDSSLGSDSGKLATRIDDYIKPRDSTETAANNTQITLETIESLTSEKTPNIAGFPKFRVKHVVDGDTVIISTFRQKLTVRLDSIDCPEDGQEWGGVATAGLIKMIGGKHVHVEEHTIDHYGRTVATLYVHSDKDSKWLNVNERMVTLGHAWVMRKYYTHLPKHRQAQLNKLERWAKSKRVGLWKLPDPIPPWKWRHGS